MADSSEDFGGDLNLLFDESISSLSLLHKKVKIFYLYRKR